MYFYLILKIQKLKFRTQNLEPKISNLKPKIKNLEFNKNVKPNVKCKM